MCHSLFIWESTDAVQDHTRSVLAEFPMQIHIWHARSSYCAESLAIPLNGSSDNEVTIFRPSQRLAVELCGDLLAASLIIVVN